MQALNTTSPRPLSTTPQGLSQDLWQRLYQQAGLVIDARAPNTCEVTALCDHNRDVCQSGQGLPERCTDRPLEGQPAVRLFAGSPTLLTKTRLGSVNPSKHPIKNETEAKALFRSMYDYQGGLGVKGNLKKGLVVYPVDATGRVMGTGQMLYVRGSEIIPQKYVVDGDRLRVGSVTFGARPGLEHTEYSWALAGDPELDVALRNAWQALIEGTEIEGLWGFNYVGHEPEYWCVDEQGLARPALHTEELSTHLLETHQESPGLFHDPVMTVQGLAREYLNLHKPEHTHPETFLVPLGCDPGTPLFEADINCGINDHFGLYMVALEKRLSGLVGVRSKGDLFYWTQIARACGFERVRSLIDSLLCPLLAFNVAASHQSVGPGTLPKTYGIIPGYKADLDMMIAQSNIYSSSLGAVLQIVSSTGPFVAGAALMSPENKYIWHARNVVRRILATSEKQTYPIKDAKTLTEIMIAGLTQGIKGADRLARAGVAVTTMARDGRQIFKKQIGHGDVRIRLEWSVDTQEGGLTGQPKMRVEYTGADATNLANKVRVQTLLQMFALVALKARAERADGDVLAEAAKIIGEDQLTAKDLWGDTQTINDDYMSEGPHAARVTTVISRLKKLLTNMPEIPAYQEIKKIALRSLEIITETGSVDLLGRGKCTVAAAMVDLAQKGYNGRQAALIMGQFALQEALWLDDERRTTEEVMDYLLGKDNAGFEFLWPRVAHLAKAPVTTPSNRPDKGIRVPAFLSAILAKKINKQ
ncbi:MAG: hypothetical protein HQM16_03990 [Deltaproteobacteria bacterium]|nr:hypothetical protein [Deltaproteobacteria bacterium]